MLNNTDIQNITPEFISMIKLPEMAGKSLNYLMVMPVLTKDKNEQYGFPVGFASVSSALKASGRKVFTLNLNYKSEPLRLLEHIILTREIDVVLTGGLGISFWEIKAIIDAVKAINPDIVTIVGGSIISADPITAMEALENADYGVIGEGEITINLLAYALEKNRDKSVISDMEGIIYLENDKWVVREQNNMIPNLDILPFPDYEGFEYNLLFEKIDWVFKRLHWEDASSYIGFVSFSRSCPYNCTFCYHSCGDKYRRISLSVTKKLIDWLLFLYPLEVIWFEDELTFVDIDYTSALCDLLKQYKLKFRPFIHAATITKEILKLIGESNGTAWLGIESADNRILKSMRKHITIEQVNKALEYADELGIFIRSMLIFGDLEETVETFWRTIDWWQSHYIPGVNIIELGLICAYPGTHLYKVACERGIIKDRVQFLKDGYPPVNLSKMTDDEYNVIPVLFRILRLKDKLNNAEVKPLSDFTVNLAGRCPHCDNIISFAHHEHLFILETKPCPVCKQPVNVNAIEYCDSQRLNGNVTDLIDGANAAVWAVSPENHYWLLKSMPALKADNVYFINSKKLVIANNGKTVKTLAGKEVFSPDRLNCLDVDTVIIPNNKSVFHSIKEQCLADYPQIKRIVHISELL